MKEIISKIRRLLPPALSKKLPGEVKVVKISARESRRLNLKFRKKNSPANVLSFRYGKPGSRDYGEVLICPEVIQKEAASAGESYRFQMTWMILHGMIHLAGLHHEKSRRLTNSVERLEFLTLEKLAGKNAKFIA